MVIIVRNVAINLYNSRKKQLALSLDELAEWTPDEAASPSDELEAKEGSLHLAQLMARLPDGSVYFANFTHMVQNPYERLVNRILGHRGVFQDAVRKTLEEVIPFLDIW